MSDTPRTDREVYKITERDIGFEAVGATLCRTIERELAQAVNSFSEERSRAEDAVVRGLKMAEALRAILDVVEGNVVTENESAAMNVICAIADDTLEEAAK